MSMVDVDVDVDMEVYVSWTCSGVGVTGLKLWGKRILECIELRYGLQWVVTTATCTCHLQSWLIHELIRTVTFTYHI